MASKALTAVRRWATAADGVTEDVACAGTPIESATFKTSKKAFVFAQPKGKTLIVRLKLDASAAAAKAAGHDVGAGGWAKIVIDSSSAPKELERWIAESRALIGPTKASAKPKVPATPKSKKSPAKSK